MLKIDGGWYKRSSLITHHFEATLPDSRPLQQLYAHCILQKPYYKIIEQVFTKIEFQFHQTVLNMNYTVC